MNTEKLELALSIISGRRWLEGTGNLTEREMNLLWDGEIKMQSRPYITRRAEQVLLEYLTNPLIQSLKVDSNDKIVYTTPEILDEETRQAIWRELRQRFPGNDCMVVDSGSKLEVVKE